MARNAKATKKRKIMPDAVYGSVLVTKMVNNIMKDGKKTVAQSLVYKTFDLLAKKEEPLSLFEKAIQNVGPRIEIKARRVGGANYQIPIEVRSERKYALAMRWIRDAARGGKGKPMHLKLADELIAASKNEGSAIKKKEDTHKMAEANKAFAHFAW